MLIVPARSAHAAPPHVHLARSSCRHGDIRCWTGETSASIVVRAPPELLFAAYADIERMPQWSPMLESVTLVDPLALRSEWALRVPKPLTRWLRAAGMSRLVQWEAVHEVEAPRVLRWRSLSGVENSGIATFEPTDGQAGCTTVTLCMSYSLPNLAAPLVENSLAQKFVRRTMLSTMERFKSALEKDARDKGATAQAAFVMTGAEGLDSEE